MWEIDVVWCILQEVNDVVEIARPTPLEQRTCLFCDHFIEGIRPNRGLRRKCVRVRMENCPVGWQIEDRFVTGEVKPDLGGPWVGQRPAIRQASFECGLPLEVLTFLQDDRIRRALDAAEVVHRAGQCL